MKHDGTTGRRKGRGHHVGGIQPHAMQLLRDVLPRGLSRREARNLVRDVSRRIPPAETAEGRARDRRVFGAIAQVMSEPSRA